MIKHVHLIVAAKNHDLSAVIGDLKKYTSSQILKALRDNPAGNRKEWMLEAFSKAGKANCNNTHYKFWRQDNQAKELFPYMDSFMLQKLNYIHNNPVAASIVDNPEYYLYSSARDYAGIKGLINIEFLEWCSDLKWPK